MPWSSDGSDAYDLVAAYGERRVPLLRGSMGRCALLEHHVETAVEASKRLRAG